MVIRQWKIIFEVALERGLVTLLSLIVGALSLGVLNHAAIVGEL